MTWPWTRTAQTLQAMQTQVSCLCDLLIPMAEQVAMLHRLALDAEQTRREEDQRVGQTWLMSPGEQAEQERTLMAQSEMRVRTRHYGSSK